MTRTKFLQIANFPLQTRRAAEPYHDARMRTAHHGRRLATDIRYGLGGMAGLVAVGVATLYAVTTPRLERVYVVPAGPFIIPRSDAAIARGRHLARIYLCHECHGADSAVACSRRFRSRRRSRRETVLGHGGATPVIVPRLARAISDRRTPMADR